MRGRKSGGALSQDMVVICRFPLTDGTARQSVPQTVSSNGSLCSAAARDRLSAESTAQQSRGRWSGPERSSRVELRVVVCDGGGDGEMRGEEGGYKISHQVPDHVS